MYEGEKIRWNLGTRIFTVTLIRIFLKLIYKFYTDFFPFWFWCVQNYIIIVHTALIAQYNQLVYNVLEPGPAAQICIDLVSGIVGNDGLTINIVNSGGTAAREWIGKCVQLGN